jgi:hypothetical protein
LPQPSQAAGLERGRDKARHARIPPDLPPPRTIRFDAAVRASLVALDQKPVKLRALPAAAEVRHDDGVIGIGYLVEGAVAADPDAAQIR